MTTAILILLFVGVTGSLLAVLITTLFLHKRSAGRQLDVIGALGAVEIQLDPEGAIIVNGELWRARAQQGMTLTYKTRIRVVGAQAHLLVVELAPDRS